jgi:hypothetical protein
MGAPVSSEADKRGQLVTDLALATARASDLVRALQGSCAEKPYMVEVNRELQVLFHVFWAARHVGGHLISAMADAETLRRMNL